MIQNDRSKVCAGSTKSKISLSIANKLLGQETSPLLKLMNKSATVWSSPLSTTLTTSRKAFKNLLVTHIPSHSGHKVSKTPNQNQLTSLNQPFNTSKRLCRTKRCQRRRRIENLRIIRLLRWSVRIIAKILISRSMSHRSNRRARISSRTQSPNCSRKLKIWANLSARRAKDTVMMSLLKSHLGNQSPKVKAFKTNSL